MKLKKILYVILGCIGVGLGAVGDVLPLLSVGFLMMHQGMVGWIVLACVWVFHILSFCQSRKNALARQLLNVRKEIISSGNYLGTLTYKPENAKITRYLDILEGGRFYE